MQYNKVYQGNCLEIMNKIDEKSIDMILCDLPLWDNQLQMGHTNKSTGALATL